MWQAIAARGVSVHTFRKVSSEARRAACVMSPCSSAAAPRAANPKSSFAR